YGVERMSLIGSATNKEKFSPETSDVDCLVKFSNEHENLNERFLGLGGALGKACHRPVEVVFESALQNDAFRKIVEKSKILIYDASHDCT
ncbi:MAG: nucleotidyltransferase domain-containing protein, partial [Verrucomicrobiota bacterium]